MKNYNESPEIPQPVKRPPVLKQIDIPEPPRHTQIQPRCVTCQHFEMCKFRNDYLKTITLLQRVLGDPQVDYELTCRRFDIPGFIGFNLYEWDKYLPQSVDFIDNRGKVIFFAAKFNGINNVNIVYKNDKYYILIKFKFNTENSEYELFSCKEAFYKVPFELVEESIKTIQKGLLEWRNMIIDKPAPPPPPKREIINTTHFSALLNCDIYNWNKKDYETSLKQLVCKYPNGIPMSDDENSDYYHIATFHIENHRVPYPPLDLTIGVVDKPCKPHESVRRRGDIM